MSQPLNNYFKNYLRMGKTVLQINIYIHISINISYIYVTLGIQITLHELFKMTLQGVKEQNTNILAFPSYTKLLMLVIYPFILPINIYWLPEVVSVAVGAGQTVMSKSNTVLYTINQNQNPKNKGAQIKACLQILSSYKVKEQEHREIQ